MMRVSDLLPTSQPKPPLARVPSDRESRRTCKILKLAARKEPPAGLIIWLRSFPLHPPSGFLSCRLLTGLIAHPPRKGIQRTLAVQSNLFCPSPCTFPKQFSNVLRKSPQFAANLQNHEPQKRAGAFGPFTPNKCPILVPSGLRFDHHCLHRLPPPFSARSHGVADYMQLGMQCLFVARVRGILLVYSFGIYIGWSW